MSAATRDIKKDTLSIQKKMGVVGRQDEMEGLLHCVMAQKHVLLEGPVGVGKTFLVSGVAEYLNRGVVRIDGDSRYSEHKLTGWFDPPTVLKKGYSKNAFFAGPLLQAMQAGSILFINELNRMPEGVQNILLPALDEKKIEIPRIGTIAAKAGFVVVATQNPKEFVATSHLSEALLDRFELISLHYQSASQELEILRQATTTKKNSPNEDLLAWAVALVRSTRESPLFKRGASIRAGISVVDIATSYGGTWDAFLRAAALALPNRIELSEEGLEAGLTKAIESLVPEIKKKSQALN